jgi:hypothetical protein
VAEFFRLAGVPISCANGWVVIEGVRAFEADRARRSVVQWNVLIDRLVLAHCAERFVDALTRNGPIIGENIKAFFDRERHGFELRQGEEELALVTATMARVYGGDSIGGNFLCDGAHWQKLADAVRRAEERRAFDAANEGASRPMADDASQRWVLLNGPPAAVQGELLAACLEASADIRLRRSIAYSQTVVLSLADAELRVRPIARSRSGALTVPFEFRAAGRDSVGGAIVLGGSRDPLPFRVAADAPAHLLAHAWATALLGFAAATCFSVEPSPRVNGAVHRGSGPHRRGRSPRDRSPSRTPQPRVRRR